MPRRRRRTGAWRGFLRWPPMMTLVLSLGWVLVATEPARSADQPVDLELVLAVDASSSVSTEEFDLQIRGLAEAFRDPPVIEAIRAAGDLGIAVSLMQWSDSRKQIVAVDWTAVRGEAAARALADEIEATPRFLIGGGTAIGGAVAYATRQFDNNGFEGRRKVIDVSGDGRTNQGPQAAHMRDIAVGVGITINGLAILNEDPTVDSYYYANVIGGTGAFVITANDYEAYGKAIQAKLIKEISGAPIARAPAAPGPQPGSDWAAHADHRRAVAARPQRAAGAGS